MKKYIWEHKFNFLLILVISFLTWFKILSRYPTGEGYFYFAYANSINLKNITISSVLADYGVLARLFFLIFIPIFKDNVIYYMYLQFTLMLATYFSFYFTFEKIFKEKTFAITSTLFFITNYIGQFTMMGQGDYQRFIQRVPNLILAFFGLLFLTYFLEKKKNKFLVISIIIYLLGTILSHYNIFLAPIFIFLPLLYSFFNKRKSFIKMSLLSAFYMIAPVLISKTDPLSHPTKSLLLFITTTPDLIKMILYQIPIAGLPVQLVQYFSSIHKPVLLPPYTQIMPVLFILTVTLLSIVFIKIQEDTKLKTYYLTFILSLFTVLFLIIYAYGTIPNPLISYGEDRIYFIHSILFALIWAIVIKTLISLKNKKLYFLTVIIILLLNMVPIWRDMDKIEIHSDIQKIYLSYIKKISPSFNKDTVIVVPSELLNSSVFIQRIYGIGNANMISFDDNWQKNVAATKVPKTDIYIIDFTYKLTRDGNPDSKTLQIVDLTQDFRDNKKIIPVKH